MSSVTQLSVTQSDLTRFLVPELKQFLNKRGISCSIYRKEHLLRLSMLALELELEVIDQTGDDYKDMDKTRRTVTEEGKTYLLPSVTEIPEWSSDLTKMPVIEPCDILIYCIKFCGWSEDRLSCYKEDNGYRLFVSNHIDTVQLYEFENYVYIRSTCVPETRQSDHPYSVWIIVRKNGVVKTGGCSCVVDNGTCKHCIALLFAVQAFSCRHMDRFTETVTDLPCVWDKPRKSSQPLTVNEIDIRKNPTNSLPYEANPTMYKPSRTNLLLTNHQIEKRVHKLCKNNKSVSLHTLSDSSDDSDDESVLPFTLTELGQKYRDTSTRDDNLSFLSFVKKEHSDAIIDQIETITRGQSDNNAWFEYRRGRITASLFSSVCHFNFNGNSEDNYLTRQIFQTSSFSTPATEFGREHEPIARQMFINLYKKSHKGAKLSLCGLKVFNELPIIGATPDGVLECKCCGKGLVEIKCSWKFQNETPKSVCGKNYYDLCFDENQNVCLKTSSAWYFQIQGQLGVCGMKWCNFVFYTKKGITTERIVFDPEIFELIVNKSKLFFERFIERKLC